MKKEPKRVEVKEEDRWNLESMYQSIEDWENDYQKVLSLEEELLKYKNHLLDNADTLYNYLKDSDAMEMILENLMIYANMKSDEDTTNTKYIALQGKIENLAVKISEEFSFVTPELLSKDYSIIESFYQENPNLKEYEFDLKDIFRFKEHTLSEKEERILSSLSNDLDYSNKTASIIRDSDIKFGNIIDENGNEVELTNNNYSIYIRSKNREVRKSAFKEMYKTYGQLKNTLATTYAGEVDSNIHISKLRNYNSARERALFAGNIDISVYDNLIDTVNKSMDVIYKYYDLKKEMLKLDELHLYDIYTDLIEENDENYTYEEAKDLVIDALGVLGEDYITNLKKAFAERWIDKYPNQGKRGGAYSWGSYNSKPFVLLNYQNKLDDVSTLAHELGHSMHSYYSKENNPYHCYNYRIFVAEVASTVNEMLLYKHMLKKTDKKEEKLVILNNLLELFKGTIYRQTMFAEFERDIYTKVEDGEIITYDLLCDEYYKLNKKYFGDNVVVDEEIKYEWARIPHFYMNFYVYQYATGLSAAAAIVTDILGNKENAKENYLKFLTLGGSMYPIDELKVAGVDMTKPEVIEKAINMFNDIIDEFKEVYNS